MNTLDKDRAWRPLTRRRYVGIAVFFVIAMAITWGLGAWRAAQVAGDVEAAQESVASGALTLVQNRFYDLQRDLLARAQAIAREPVVVDALRERGRTGERSVSTPLLDYVAELELPERWAVELYDAGPVLVAWNGYSMPLDDAPNALRFLETFQTAIAEDGSWQEALVVWYPVREGPRTVGAVRIMRLLRTQTPVQNQYLHNYNVAYRWQRRAGLPMQVEFERIGTGAAPLEGQARLLQGLDGAVLGRVVITPPSPEQLLEMVRTRYNDVLAFWATLLALWGMAGLWMWYRSAPPGPSEARRWWTPTRRFVVVAAAWWTLRYVLLELDVPARWQRGRAPLAPLFDPIHLASTLGGGLMRSTGELFITSVFAVLFALAFLDFIRRRTRPVGSPAVVGREFPEGGRRSTALLRFWGSLVAALSLALVLVVAVSLVARRAVLDSTLGYFDRSGLLPEPLILVVYCALLLTMLAAVMLAVGLGWWVLRERLRYGGRELRAGRRVAVATVLVVAIPVVVAVEVLDGLQLAPVPVVLAFLVVGFGVATFCFDRRGGGLNWLTLRSVLPSILVLSVLLYPMFYQGQEVRRRVQMVDAAESFDEGRDPRVMFAMERVLREALTGSSVADLLAAYPEPSAVRRARLDSLASVLLEGSLISSLGAYDVSLAIVDAEGRPAGRHDGAAVGAGRSVLDMRDAEQFGILRDMYTESGTEGPLVQQMTGRLETGRFQYQGIVPIDGPEGERLGWVLIRAEPRALLHDEGTPFPRVLLPAAYSDLYADLSLAEFRNGVLIRSFGRDFGRYRLDERIRHALMTEPEGWHVERVKERQYLTLYRRQMGVAPGAPVLSPVESTVVAVRVPVITTFDHLFYLLRIALAGLFVGLLFYGIGLVLRWRSGLLPAPRVRFRDRVLNAFLGVGIVAIAAVGFIGVRVVQEENERAIQGWLRQHLERVEEALRVRAQGDEMPYRVLDRVSVDSLAAQVGLDLNLYEGAELVASTRPQLVRERLIDRRLPIEAFESLYDDGYQIAFVDQSLGSFTYTAGYAALLGEDGWPRYVIAVPTLPEQERIEEERARAVAYLFGALLLMVIVVMLTALLLANALARPIARLRVGLQDVARGRFERKLPVTTRDEIGELVQTFNEMQEQLADSRRRLAQQERQLAWREMARQVAHEIKNPLTPMKLSIQHLRRAFNDRIRSTSNGTGAFDDQFAALFDRITSTLIEQIDTLARIANEFSSFARMPTRVVERLDLNAVVREAVSLMQAEAEAEIETRLHHEPLVLEADHEELRRIYINLIKNAIQALPDGEGRVVVTTEREAGAGGGPGWAYSAVADTGVGIPEALHERIFEPNFSTKTSGTGLGLAITRQSIEELNGEIGFETEEGGGTTFWVRLPLIE